MKILLILLLSFYSFSAISKNTQEDIDILISKAQYQKAVNLINECQEKPKELLLKEALCYKALRKYRDAINLLEDLSNNDISDISVRLQLASCYEVAGLYDKAIRCYDELIDLDSENEYFKIQQADLLYLQAKYDLALAKYQVLSKKDSSSYLYKRIGMSFDKLNQLDSSQMYFKRAYDIDITDNFLLANLINIHLKQESYKQALDISSDFIEKDSTNQQINLLNAMTYYALNRYDEAVVSFERCRVAGDSSLLVNKSLGISYYYLGNSEKAYPYLKQAYLQDSTNNNILYALASSEKDLEFMKEAINNYNTLLKRVIPSSGVLYAYYKDLADSYKGAEEYQNAVNNYKLALDNASFNQSIDLLFTIADVYHLNIKDKESAISYYNKYVEKLGRLRDESKLKEENAEYIDKRILKTAEIIQELRNKK